ncbi:hypothetical protein PENSPDRAFT_754657 [Peniophora sp. CONT]|nr:hypothetical protein PENSPDRAFT_754657 [Peniophora sp. CONT]
MLSKLQKTSSHLDSPAPAGKDENGTLPIFDELPKFHELSGCAWNVWGKGDQLGTVNLLTNAVVKRASQEEIKTGQAVALNWPINFPEKPVFGRRAPEIKSHYLGGFGDSGIRDDEIHINTQSGTQWDCFKHFPALKHATIYGGINVDELPIGHISFPDPMNVDPEIVKMGVQNWAQHGICGRGVFLDLVEYYTKNGGTLPYDPWTTHSITVPELESCAKSQGTTFRQGDILILRVGFMQKYNRESDEARVALAGRPETFAGIEQSEDMKRFLWNNHFAAIASDQPALEAWPPAGEEFMHETILSMWGMPLGEFFDVEKLSEVCKRTGRYTFFFSSWPLNVLGGVASPPNAAAYF